MAEAPDNSMPSTASVVHAPEAIGSPPTGEYEPVTFAASDGLELSGWYRASQNGAGDPVEPMSGQ